MNFHCQKDTTQTLMSKLDMRQLQLLFRSNDNFLGKLNDNQNLLKYIQLSMLNNPNYYKKDNG